MNVIEVNNLSKKYGNISAINSISFSVQKGSMFAFLGPNGAGKSTTINILCSILAKDEGIVKICGSDLDKDSELIKNKIGIVFQNSVLDKALTVKENLQIRASFYGLNKKSFQTRLEELNTLLDIKKILNQKYGTLSGGQKRKVDIARALINKPEILFLDEPTTGLDPQTRINVWKAIDDLRSETGLTVFLTTHYMEEVISADMVVIINEGVIVECDSPSNLKLKYSSDEIKLVCKRNEELDNVLNREKLQYSYEVDHYIIYIDNSKLAKDFIIKYSDLITDFEVLNGNMDKVFLKITGKKLLEE